MLDPVKPIVPCLSIDALRRELFPASEVATDQGRYSCRFAKGQKNADQSGQGLVPKGGNELNRSSNLLRINQSHATSCLTEIYEPSRSYS